MILSIFVPVVVVPFILSRTLYKDTKAVELEELPRFTPEAPVSKVLFDSSMEGMQLLLLVIIPAVAAVYTVIGVLDFAGVWSFIQSTIGSFLTIFGVEPSTGVLSVLVSPTLAVAQMPALVGMVDPRLIVGGFVLANSGLPISVIFGQVPVTGAEYSNLNEQETMKAAILGCVIRIATAALLAYLLTPLLI